MNKYLLVGIVAILIIAGWWYLSQSSSTIVSETNSQQMSQQHTNAVEQPRQQDTGVRAQTNPVSKQQTAPLISGNAIKVTSPNGGETFKLGSTVHITWNAQNVPSDAELEFELFEITGGQPIISEQGACTNCTENGLLSGVPFVSVSNGTGSAEWVAGKQYDGSFVNPGSRYIMKATVSKSGSVDAGECPRGSFKKACEVFYQIDWSDEVFSLTN